MERKREATPELLRSLLRKQANPYAGADLANARRLVGVLSVLSGLLVVTSRMSYRL